MLQVDLRALVRGPIETAGSLAVDDPLLADLGFMLADPVRVTGRLSMTGPGRYYWAAEVKTRITGTCRRCLEPVAIRVASPVSILFTEDEASDDPSSWVIPAHATALDLRDSVREELILAVPEYVLCREDCRGICPHCGQELNLGSCTCRTASDPRWGTLEALKGQLPDEPR